MQPIYYPHHIHRLLPTALREASLKRDPEFDMMERSSSTTHLDTKTTRFNLRVLAPFLVVAIMLILLAVLATVLLDVGSAHSAAVTASP